MRDFFISYNKDDKTWAEWIAWILEEAGYETYIQAWDFVPGCNFVHEMDRAVRESQRTIAILSPHYIGSDFARSEWLAAFAGDPTGEKRKLLPVRIAPVDLDGLLAQRVYVDIVGLGEGAAKGAILGALSVRRKPETAPTFPGGIAHEESERKPFPVVIKEWVDNGQATDIVGIATPGFFATTPRNLSSTDRLNLVKALYAIVPGEFNQILFAINPPPALIPPMPAAQSDRVTALLAWAESPSGTGLGAIKELLAALGHP